MCVGVSSMCMDMSSMRVDVSSMCMDVPSMCVDMPIMCVDVSSMCVDVSNVANLPAATINVAGGYTITKVNDNKYTFNSGVTASVTLEGGGDIASAGPVTVTA